MHVNLGGYHISDIEFTLGIDVNVTKVGRDLSEAIFAEPNNTYKFSDVPNLNAPVVRGSIGGRRSRCGLVDGAMLSAVAPLVSRNA